MNDQQPAVMTSKGQPRWEKQMTWLNSPSVDNEGHPERRCGVNGDRVMFVVSRNLTD